MRDNWLSNRAFKSYEEILDQCCCAWNKLINQPWRINVQRYARLRPWAAITARGRLKLRRSLWMREERSDATLREYQAALSERGLMIGVSSSEALNRLDSKTS